MIVCNLQPDHFELKGHAGYKPKGQDIVCAGISALIETFLISTNATDSPDITVFRYGSGDVCVKWKELTPEIFYKLDMLYDGLLSMSFTYGKYIEIESFEKPKPVE